MTGIWKYQHLLPALRDDCRLTLGEANTPLVRSRRLGRAMGLENLYFKLETVNPSGSYKDRFAACAVADLLQRNINFCIATSSGNTGAALAAYGAAAGIQCFLVLVDGAPEAKVRQMQVYGASTLMVRGFGKDAVVSKEVMDGLTALARRHGGLVQISAYCCSPAGMTGVQTIAYEIAESLPKHTAHVFSPAGGGGLTLALTKGFRLWKQMSSTYRCPRVHCVQPSGNDTIAGPLRAGLRTASAIQTSATSISGLQVPNVLDGDMTIEGCRSTGGSGWTVPDELIYECQRELAVKEGIFCEPAGAAALAGVKLALKSKEMDKSDHIVCLVTGHGFKDLVSAGKIAARSDNRYFENARETFQYIESNV